MMTTGFVGAQGYPPKLSIGQGNPEALKYGKLWEYPEYRRVSPGEILAQTFLQHAGTRPGAHVIDFGCGTGRGALALALLGGCKVTMVDFVRNCLDPEVTQAITTQAHVLSFLKADLEQAIPVTAEFGFCCDVLEHIPPDRLDAVLDNILAAARHIFFSISTTHDECGQLIGETLHLSQHPYSWWLEQFQRRKCLIHWCEDQEQWHRCLFYVTGWTDGQTIVDAGRLNVTDDEIRSHVRENCGNGWQQVEPHPTNDLEVMILGGGPSLPLFLQDIRTKRADGVKLITINGTYNWCLEHGLTPSAQIMVDAREFNKRFTTPAVDGCKYLLASQCHPSVFEGLPKDRTYLFHTSAEMIKDILDEVYPDHRWWPIPGGSTALLRAIPLLRMLGYRHFHLYGCDSCLSEEQAHHAYAQPENDSKVVVPVMVTGGRIFHCHLWMAAQAQEMMSLIQVLGNEIDLAIYGDGLLAHILTTGAQMAELDEGQAVLASGGLDVLTHGGH